MIQAKAEVGSKGPRPKRGSKRRGRRSGCRNGRKRRRLITAAPDSCTPSSPPPSRLERLMYLSERQMKYRLDVTHRYGVAMDHIKHVTPQNPYYGPKVHGLRKLEDRLTHFVSKMDGLDIQEARSLLRDSVTGLGGIEPRGLSLNLVLNELRYGKSGTQCEHTGPHRWCHLCGGCKTRPFALRAGCESCRAYTLRRQPRVSKTRQVVAKARSCDVCGSMHIVGKEPTSCLP